jgi:hypothetical protein
MKFRPQFQLWHLLALTTLVCIVCAFPILLGPVLFICVTATVAVGALRLLTRRQLTIVLWIAATIAVAMAVVVGQQYIWLVERHDYLRANPGAAGGYCDAPGLLRLFHGRGTQAVRVICAPYGSTEPYCVTYARKLFPEATIIVEAVPPRN